MKHLYFDAKIGMNKPKTISDKNKSCPFCDVENLDGILFHEENIILVKNKYPTLHDTYQTVLIENDSCDLDMTQYDKGHLYKLIRFGVRSWMNMIHSGKYESVMFYKNHGPLSGGTIYHPHMQIVGLNNVDINQDIKMEQFEGLAIFISDQINFNLSTKPKMGFYEFNIHLKSLEQIDVMADFIQMTTDFILNHYSYNCTSYNIFFYYLNEEIFVKIIPRFITSPLYVGYSIPQVPMNLEKVIEKFKNTYSCSFQ